MSAQNKASIPMWWERWRRAGALATIPLFKTWARVWTIKLAPGLNKITDFIEEFKKAGYKMSDYTEKVLIESNMVVEPTQTEVNLVMVSGSELGFTKPASRQKIYSRAARLGLGIAPSWAGLQLRLNRSNQPVNESLLIAMEPLTGSGHSVGIILKRHGDGEQRVNTTEIVSWDLWDPEELWVFQKK